jgi:Haem utilisation ChuX/HutX
MAFACSRPVLLSVPGRAVSCRVETLLSPCAIPRVAWARKLPSRARLLASAADADAPAANRETDTSGAGSADTVAKVRAFLADARELGTVRFIAVADGAVLEAVGRFDYPMAEFSPPGRDDTFLTLATEDRTFECHLKASAVRRITLTVDSTKDGSGATLPVVRFFGESARPMLSVSLMWEPSRGPGHYLHGAEDAFAALRDQYGGDYVL